jgi:hypothetical protein
MLRRAFYASSVAALLAAAPACSTVSCTDVTPIPGSICIPPTITPDQSSVIEVREACGQCTTQPTCDTTLRNGAVYLDLHSQLCSDVSVTCPSSPCLQRIVQCTLPALGAGDYALIAPGNQQYLLRVESGGVSSCTL